MNVVQACEAVVAAGSTAGWASVPAHAHAHTPPWTDVVVLSSTSSSPACAGVLSVKPAGGIAVSAVNCGSDSKQQSVAALQHLAKTFQAVKPNSLPWCGNEGDVAYVTTVGGAMKVVVVRASDGQMVFSRASLPVVDLPPTYQWFVTSCVLRGGDVYACVAAVASKPRTATSSSSQQQQYRRYFQTRSVLHARAAGDGKDAADDADAKAAPVRACVVQPGLSAAVLLPPHVHAAWTARGRQVLLAVVRDSHAAVFASVNDAGEALGGAPTSTAWTHIPFTLTRVPDWFVPIHGGSTSSGTDVFDIIVNSGTGDVALCMVDFAHVRIHYVVSMQPCAEAWQHSRLKGGSATEFVPGDVLVRHEVHGVNHVPYVVIAFSVGTVVVQRLLDDMSAFAPDEPPLKLDPAVVLAADSPWHVLPPPVVAANVTGNIITIVAGRTRLWSSASHVADHDHIMRPCGSFSLSHTITGVGMDAHKMWVAFARDAALDGSAAYVFMTALSE